MSMFFKTILCRLKQNFITAKGLTMLLLALLAAVLPLIGNLEKDDAQRPVAIGWADYDNSKYSETLLDGVKQYPLLEVKQADEEELLGELRTGNLEAVFVLHEGFENSIRNGEYEDTMTMHKSAYSSVAGVISEGVSAKLMQIWLAEYSAEIARDYGADDTEVFEGIMTYMDDPIMTIERKGELQDLESEDPLYDAAERSLNITAVICCLLMLISAAAFSDTDSFEQRLMSVNMSAESYRLALGIGDTVFLLPACIPAAAAFCASGNIGRGEITLLLFALYLLSYGGAGALLCKIKSKTIHVLSISVVSIINLAFGSLLIAMPAAGIMAKLSYVLPSRWMTSFDFLEVFAVLGLAACAVVYNCLPFILRKNKKQKVQNEKTA